MQICDHLNALDLYNLSASCETMWSLMTSTPTTSLWRRVFPQTSVPMPECPDDMSFPNYARFMLVRACMVCAILPCNLHLPLNPCQLNRAVEHPTHIISSIISIGLGTVVLVTKQSKTHEEPLYLSTLTPRTSGWHHKRRSSVRTMVCREHCLPTSRVDQVSCFNIDFGRTIGPNVRCFS